MNSQKNLILASSSTPRRELLARLQIPFKVIAPNVDETPLEHETITDMVLRLAKIKGDKVASELTATENSSIIIASDQMGIVDNHLVGKPHTRDNAIRQLQQCAGKVLSFYTSLYCLDTQSSRSILTLHRYDVHFRTYNETEILGYLDKEQPFACAGSFKSEGLGIALVDKFEGEDPNSLTGLPLIQLVKNLTELGMSPLQSEMM